MIFKSSVNDITNIKIPIPNETQHETKKKRSKIDIDCSMKAIKYPNGSFQSNGNLNKMKNYKISSVFDGVFVVVVIAKLTNMEMALEKHHFQNPLRNM